MKHQSQVTALNMIEFRESGQFCATAVRSGSVKAQKHFALSDQEYRAVLEMTSPSRRARMRGKIRGKFLHRVFTAMGFLWLGNSSERNTNAGAAELDTKMPREYCI